MTIAAGIRYADGILICADSEITHGSEFKGRGTKIFPYKLKASGSKAIFTFSGDVMLSKQCIQTAARALASAPRIGLCGMYDILADEVYDFHQKYVFKHPLYQYGSAPTVNLIAAMWSAEDNHLGLFQSSEHAVVELTDADVLAITGSGGTFANYVSKPLVPHGGMKLTDVITAAVYALKEAKDNVPGCGHGSELIAITKSGEMVIQDGCIHRTWKTLPLPSRWASDICLWKPVT